jgi:hypothetical protein
MLDNETEGASEVGRIRNTASGHSCRLPELDMLGNLTIGFVMLLVCLAIQCFVASLLLRVLPILKPTQTKQSSLGAMTAALMAVMLVMVAGNVLQAALWAGLFVALGEFNDYATAFYFSMANFTTLGYGDVMISEQRRLLGALEAGNGILMLGLTTSVLFLVLSTVMQTAWNQRVNKE